MITKDFRPKPDDFVGCSVYLWWREGLYAQKGLRSRRKPQDHRVDHERLEIDNYSVYVYSPEMIAAEKLRAICQQMPEYPLKPYPTPRARDFFDIQLIVSRTGVDLTSAENLELTRQIFAAKEVPLQLLENMGGVREFHRPDWESVRTSTKAQLKEFDYYFDFVVNLVSSMKSLWNK